MSNLLERAKRELTLLRGGDTELDEMQDRMDAHILKILEVFADEGHSGFSAEYAIKCLTRLLMFLPLTPLTGEDDEWVEIREKEMGRPSCFQNNRYSAVFKENGEAYNIHGKLFSDNGGESWYSCKESRVPITFPYSVPGKPEYIINSLAE